MNTTYKYDPEDIESLLMHKQFNELYPEEKDFVLRHVEGQEEYDSLRQTLFLMRDAANEDECLEPDPSIRKNLMAQFVREEKKGFIVWLNGLFSAPFLPDMPWYKKPAMRYAFASVTLLAVVGGTFYVVSRQGDQVGIAASQTDNSQTPKDTVQFAPGEIANDGKRTYADNLKPNVFPPAPVPVDVPMKYPNVEYIPTEESAVDMIYEGQISDESGYLENTTLGSEDLAMPMTEPTLAPASADNTVRLESKTVEAVKLSKKEKSKEIDRASAQESDIAELDKEEMEAEKVVVTESAKQLYTGSNAPAESTSSPALVNESMTTSDGYTVLSATPGATYKWDAAAVSANSRNSSALKPVISILFTAK